MDHGRARLARAHCHASTFCDISSHMNLQLPGGDVTRVGGWGAPSGSPGRCCSLCTTCWLLLSPRALQLKSRQTSCWTVQLRLGRTVTDRHRYKLEPAHPARRAPSSVSCQREGDAPLTASSQVTRNVSFNLVMCALNVCDSPQLQRQQRQETPGGRDADPQIQQHTPDLRAAQLDTPGVEDGADC